MGREDVQADDRGGRGVTREQIRDSATRERRVAEAGATRFLSLDDETRVIQRAVLLHFDLAMPSRQRVLCDSCEDPILINLSHSPTITSPSVDGKPWMAPKE